MKGGEDRGEEGEGEEEEECCLFDHHHGSVGYMFQFVTYADDTTITSTGTLNIFKDQGGRIQNNKIINELNKINNWLKANKLSLNVKKTKFMIFRKPQKKVEIPVLHIGGETSIV